MSSQISSSAPPSLAYGSLIDDIREICAAYDQAEARFNEALNFARETFDKAESVCQVLAPAEPDSEEAATYREKLIGMGRDESSPKTWVSDASKVARSYNKILMEVADGNAGEEVAQHLCADRDYCDASGQGAFEGQASSEEVASNVEDDT